MVNPTEVAYDIIFELAKKAQEQTEINDPVMKELIKKLDLVSQYVEISTVKDAKDEYYSVKEVSELFDVNKQTVYKWIDQGKIEYEEDNSPGKVQRKGYLIPKCQFKTEEALNKVDPTFKNRREAELNEIPNTGFDTKNVTFPEESNESYSFEDIKHIIDHERKNK
jgi:excisionase family DNA binding protein